jgi:hypothetical protein
MTRQTIKYIALAVLIPSIVTFVDDTVWNTEDYGSDVTQTLYFWIFKR